MRNRPVLVHFHGPFAEHRYLHDARYQRQSLRYLVERSVYSRADRLVVLSEKFKGLLVDSYRVPQDRITVVPPCVDMEAFRPVPRSVALAVLGLPKGRPIVLVVKNSRGHMASGISELLDALATASACNTPKPLLVFVGEASDGVSIDPPPDAGFSLRHLGAVSHGELVAAFCAADVCVLPRNPIEGFGLVTLESLACGTPVLVSDEAGSAEFIAALSPMLLFGRGEERSLTHRLSQILTSQYRLPDGAACRELARTASMERFAAAHIEIYSELCG